MLRTMKSVWTWIGALGVTEQTAHERRRITVLNRALSLGIVVSIAYCVLYLAFGAPRAAAINAAFISFYFVALCANYGRSHRVARHVAILSANLHMLALSVFVLGEASGVHRWYWMFIVVTFLVFTRNEKRAIYGYAALSIGLFTSIEHGLMRFGAKPVISEGVASVLSVTSTVLTLVVITIIVDLFDRETGRAESALSKENERSESLLLNILPSSIASRLKDGRQEPIADSFAQVTVLFADIAGFTEMSDSLDPQRVVALLNQIFSEFDALMEKHRLEKIKTIGDAYMVAGGLPEVRADHARAVAEMALDMVEATGRYQTPTGARLGIRIGINTGPVVAGVIGVKKFIYDLWGDTVNTASRMESHGVVGAIQVTEATYQHLKHDYVLEERGPIKVKGKGPMLVYMLRGRKGESAKA
ncbi:MAG: adenylate/guanylate cyclase domain-containing protein [Planctomycetes bacterium]|nr:adenylate/guanylate cyclase domain-containing protein [Planctomycetota bacterium]